jgi:hypothetical protein
VHSRLSEELPTPLKSPIWSKLGSIYENLIVLSAWQCGAGESPGGPGGYKIFGFLAVNQKMRTNSYQSGRYTEVARDWHCRQSIAALSEQPLSPDSAYVVTPELAARIAQGPTGPGKCHDLDRFILCSTKTDFGLSSALMSPEARLENAIGNSGFEEEDLRPWSWLWEADASVSADRAHSGTHSLAERGDGSVYQDVTGLEPGRTYTISAWISASPNATAPAQLTILNASDGVATSTPAVNGGPTWQNLLHSLTVGPEGAIRVYLVRGPGSGTIYWDDIHIAREK